MVRSGAARRATKAVARVSAAGAADRRDTASPAQPDHLRATAAGFAAVLAFRWWGGTDTLPPRQGRGHPDLQAAGVRGRPGRPGRACQGTEPAGAGIGHAWACSGRDG